MSPTLWIPACPDCKTPNRDLVYLPGTEKSPGDVARLYAHWNCAACAKRIYLPKSEWVPVGRLSES